MSNEFTQHRRKQIAELRPYQEGEVLSESVSVSQADKDAGSPKVGDMIARNPKNYNDQWLVAKQYFADNFEPVESQPSPIQRLSEHRANVWTEPSPKGTDSENLRRWKEDNQIPQQSRQGWSDEELFLMVINKNLAK